MVVPLRDSGVPDSAFLPGMLFGPTTVEICGCLYPSAGPKNSRYEEQRELMNLDWE
jgi:hypothetical protein